MNHFSHFLCRHYKFHYLPSMKLEWVFFIVLGKKTRNLSMNQMLPPPTLIIYSCRGEKSSVGVRFRSSAPHMVLWWVWWARLMRLGLEVQSAAALYSASHHNLGGQKGTTTMLSFVSHFQWRAMKCLSLRAPPPLPSVGGWVVTYSRTQMKLLLQMSKCWTADECRLWQSWWGRTLTWVQSYRSYDAAPPASPYHVSSLC